MITPVNSLKKRTSSRRYDVDWLRVLALGLLIIYHVVECFQPWSKEFLFIQNNQTLELLWIPMSAINIWRIPILFVISGMGVRFAMKHRHWRQLLRDRAVRILVPLVFGSFLICPISLYLYKTYYGGKAFYMPFPGHLWFLGNIFLYVLILLPFLVYLKQRPNNRAFQFAAFFCQNPFGLFLFAIPLMIEAWLIDPELYGVYMFNLHGLFVGMICFLTGFILISLNNIFWRPVKKIRWVAIGIAFLGYLIRLFVYQFQGVPNPMIAFESMAWMLAIFGFASIYLNNPSKKLSFFSKAVYPVYIIHLPIQLAISYALFPLDLPVTLELIILLVGTFTISLMIYEFIIRQIKWIQPIFGIKMQSG